MIITIIHTIIHLLLFVIINIVHIIQSMSNLPSNVMKDGQYAQMRLSLSDTMLSVKVMHPITLIPSH
jgi:hypothetical protein